MKTIQKLLFFAVLTAITSCSDNADNMLTVIYPDGSCRREFSAHADSAFMTGNLTGENNPFPVEIDSAYAIAWQYKNGEICTDFPISSQKYDSLAVQDTTTENAVEKEKNFLIILVQNYKSIDEMAEKFTLKPSHPWKDMSVKYHFEKKFHFFYSYFTYKETYPQIELPFDEPITNYMSEDEADFWFTGEPNLTKGMSGMEIYEYAEELKQKYENWFTRNIWNLHYKFIIENYDSIKNPPVSKKEFIRLKDTIFEEKHKTNTIQTDRINAELDNYFNTKVFSACWEMKDLDENFENQDFLSFFGKEFSYQLIMPGKIISTNGVNRNDTLSWHLSAYRMIPGDYSMEAQSRKLNSWMLVLTVTLALTAIGIFVYKKKKLSSFY